MTCNLDTGYDFIEVQNIKVRENYGPMAQLLSRHPYLITRIDNLGIDNLEEVTDVNIRNIHVHIRHWIFVPYVKHLIRKYLKF